MPKKTSVADITDPKDKELIRSALQSELDRVYDRIEKNNEGTGGVIQYIILVFGVILVAAVREPVVFLFVPIFWTVWMLHSRIVDFNTLKLSIYAAKLERDINHCLPIPLYFWESRFTQRGNTRPFMFDLNFGYWGLMNAASWIGAVVVLLHERLYLPSTFIACLWVLLWAPFLRDVKARDATMASMKDQVEAGGAAADLPIRVPSDTVLSHLRTAISAAIALLISLAIFLFDRSLVLTAVLDGLAVVVLFLVDFSAPGPGQLIRDRSNSE